MSVDLGVYEVNTIVVGDCLEVMRQMPDECCDLIFADPPYNKGKADWDKGHDWHDWVAGAVRVLKFSGALWIIHDDPDELLDISRFIVETRGPPRINWITWDKYNGNPTRQAGGGPMMGFTIIGGLRSFQRMAEYLIYHADRGLLGKRLLKARRFCGLTCDAIERRLGRVDSMGRGSRLFYRWERGESIPTKADYVHAMLVCRGQTVRQLDLVHHPKLCAEYEDLSPVFNNPGLVSSVWQGPPAKRTEHETPKPEWLLERIISTTSNEGDLVADFFMGSGTTAVAADRLGRNFFGCDINRQYVDMALKRLDDDRAKRAQLELF